MSITDRNPETSNPRYSREDWNEVSDNPELTENELAGLRVVTQFEIRPLNETIAAPI